jgi:hypothetical protein
MLGIDGAAAECGREFPLGLGIAGLVGMVCGAGEMPFMEAPVVLPSAGALKCRSPITVSHGDLAAVWIRGAPLRRPGEPKA